MQWVVEEQNLTTKGTRAPEPQSGMRTDTLAGKQCMNQSSVEHPAQAASPRMKGSGVWMEWGHLVYWAGGVKSSEEEIPERVCEVALGAQGKQDIISNG